MRSGQAEEVLQPLRPPKSPCRRRPKCPSTPSRGGGREPRRRRSARCRASCRRAQHHIAGAQRRLERAMRGSSRWLTNICRCHRRHPRAVVSRRLDQQRVVTAMPAAGLDGMQMQAGQQQSLSGSRGPAVLMFVSASRG
jgi:hypothetical protein